MNKQRLQALANVLRNVPPVHFNLSCWRCNTNVKTEARHENATDEQLVEHYCGTTGCAIGWACAMPEFQAQGLVWNLARGVPELIQNGYKDTGWEAVQALFSISYREAQLLFLSDKYVDRSNTTPNQVADAIEAFIKEQP